MSYFSTFHHSTLRDLGPGGKPLTADITLLSVNPTGTRVVNARTDRSVRIWKALLQTLADPVTIDNPHSKAVTRVSWNPNTDTSFATVGGDVSVKLWKGNGTLEREIRVTKKGHVVCELAEFSPDGRLMAVVDKDGTMNVYDVLENYTKVGDTKLPSHVNDIMWTNRGHSVLLAALDDGKIAILSIQPKISDVKKKYLIETAHTLKGHRSAVTCLAMDPKGRYFAAGSDDGSVSFWTTSDMICNKVLANVDQGICSVDISKDGTHVAVGYSETGVKVYDYNTMAEVYEVPNSNAVSPLVRWFPNKVALVSVGEKGRVMDYGRAERK